MRRDTLGDAFTSAIKISCIICTAGIVLGLLDILLFIVCLIVFTIGFYVYRLIFPTKPIDDIYDIEDMCSDYLKRFISEFKKRLPLKVNDKITLVDLYINDKKLISTYTCYYSDEKDLPDTDKTKEYMYSLLNKDSSCPLVFIALVYLRDSWMIRYKCVPLQKSIEVVLSTEEIEAKVSEWHEFGEEYKKDWGYNK